MEGKDKGFDESGRAGGGFLLRPSPDLNEIEGDFSALKRARMYADRGTSVDEVIRPAVRCCRRNCCTG
jgi:putative transposase